jgi:hypothetical protein
VRKVDGVTPSSEFKSRRMRRAQAIYAMERTSGTAVVSPTAGGAIRANDTRPGCDFPRYTPFPHLFTVRRIVSDASRGDIPSRRVQAPRGDPCYADQGEVQVRSD